MPAESIPVSEPVTAPGIPNLSAGVGVDTGNPADPIVIIALSNAGIAAEFRMPARIAPDFVMRLSARVMQVAQEALTAAPPQIITPNGGVGGLFLPSPHPMPKPNGLRP